MTLPNARRLLVGGSVLLVAGWLGLMALVAPALLGAVAAATLLPLTLVLLPYAAVRLVARSTDTARWSARSTSPDAAEPSERRSEYGTADD